MTSPTETATAPPRQGPFGARLPWVFVDGEFIPDAEARFSVHANVLSYGTGTFEGIRAMWSEQHAELYMLEPTHHFERMRVLFAQLGYPHEPGSKDQLAHRLTADLVCEGIDETRGWLYTTLALSTALFDQASYSRALCVGPLAGEDRRDEPQPSGGQVDPWPLVEAHGADALRWALLMNGAAWQPRVVSEAAVHDAARRLLHTLWNVLSFFTTYANLSGWTPSEDPDPVHVLDRWILSELSDTTRAARRYLDKLDAAKAGRRIVEFVDDLSNWYVRRSRDRLSPRYPDAADRSRGFATLERCLQDLAGLLAPLTPFLADALHQTLSRNARGDAAPSVHLTAYPAPQEGWDDPALTAAMRTARKLVRLGRDARTASGIPGRQPLAEAVLVAPRRDHEALAELTAVVAAEINVEHAAVRSDAGDAVVRTLRPNFAALGPRFGPGTPVVAEGIVGLDPDAAARELRQHGRLAVPTADGTVEVSPDQVSVAEEPGDGWQVASEGPYGVALRTAVDRRLRLQGVARELARAVNDLRRRHGLQLGDTAGVEIHVVADPEGLLADALQAHADQLARDVGADRLSYHLRGEPGGASPGEAVDVADGRLAVQIRPAAARTSAPGA